MYDEEEGSVTAAGVSAVVAVIAAAIALASSLATWKASSASRKSATAAESSADSAKESVAVAREQLELARRDLAPRISIKPREPGEDEVEEWWVTIKIRQATEPLSIRASVWGLAKYYANELVIRQSYDLDSPFVTGSTADLKIKYLEIDDEGSAVDAHIRYMILIVSVMSVPATASWDEAEPWEFHQQITWGDDPEREQTERPRGQSEQPSAK